jgi:hypothetical protein
MLSEQLREALKGYKNDLRAIATVQKVLKLSRAYFVDDLDYVLAFEPYEDSEPTLEGILDTSQLISILGDYNLLTIVGRSYTQKDFRQVVSKHFMFEDVYKISAINDNLLCEVVDFLQESLQEATAGLSVVLCVAENHGALEVNGTIVNLGKQSRRFLICQIVLGDNNPYKTWSWDEIVEKLGEHSEGPATWRMKIYRACRGVNEKIAAVAHAEPLFLHDTHELKLNPAYKVT